MHACRIRLAKVRPIVELLKMKFLPAVLFYGLESCQLSNSQLQASLLNWQ